VLTGQVSRPAVETARRENPSLLNRRDDAPWEPVVTGREALR
jgi:hypothetical protein